MKYIGISRKRIYGIKEGEWNDGLGVLYEPNFASPAVACEASMAMDRVRLLPDRQRNAIMILADGGSALDVAKKFGVPPWEALQIISEARDYVDRV